MEHLTPHCTSSEVFRGIIGDNAKAVFNGRIHIVKGAQKTNAQLSNKNLLASDTAEVNTKPELEIYANDVLCAHGATVAQLDKELLYYMQSRGIDRKSAEMMLSYGFVNELIAAIRIDAIADYLRPMVQQ
jgi:Fe-S cluster assembly protein SufD